MLMFYTQVTVDITANLYLFLAGSYVYTVSFTTRTCDLTRPSPHMKRKQTCLKFVPATSAVQKQVSNSPFQTFLLSATALNKLRLY